MMDYIITQDVQSEDGQTFYVLQKRLTWPYPICVGDGVEIGQLVYKIEKIRHMIDANQIVLFPKKKVGKFQHFKQAMIEDGFECHDISELMRPTEPKIEQSNGRTKEPQRT